MSKVPKKWTSEEDRVLQQQVTVASSQGKGNDWTSIAAALPGRSNKDCRKRWCNHLVGELRKGPWEPSEDRRLAAGVRDHGQQWPLVAEEVGTRSADQCAKRWHQSLDPALDHSKWSDEEEKTLLKAVDKHGRSWKTIQTRYFPGRATNNVKNRYVTLTRRRDSTRENARSARARSGSSTNSSVTGSDEMNVDSSSVTTAEASPTTDMSMLDDPAWSTDFITNLDLAQAGKPHHAAADPLVFDLLVDPDIVNMSHPDPAAAEHHLHSQTLSGDPFSASPFAFVNSQPHVTSNQTISPLLATTSTSNPTFTIPPSATTTATTNSSPLSSPIFDPLPLTGSPFDFSSPISPTSTSTLPSGSLATAATAGPHHGSSDSIPGMDFNLANINPEYILTLADPAPETVNAVMGTLVESGTRFRMEMR